MCFRAKTDMWISSAMNLGGAAAWVTTRYGPYNFTVPKDNVVKCNMQPNSFDLKSLHVKQYVRKSL